MTDRDYVTYRDTVVDRKKRPRRPYGALPVALLHLLDEQSPQSTTALAQRLPDHSVHQIRVTLGRMTHARTVARCEGGWQIGACATVPRVPRAKEPEWTPVPWIHPIRRRLLGLPVAEARRDVPETDFGNPLRKVAA
jgi:hypothetical protein